MHHDGYCNIGNTPTCQDKIHDCLIYRIKVVIARRAEQPLHGRDLHSMHLEKSPRVHLSLHGVRFPASEGRQDLLTISIAPFSPCFYF